MEAYVSELGPERIIVSTTVASAEAGDAVLAEARRLTAQKGT
jgi:hypothetical protein